MEVEMSAGYEVKDVPADILSVLRKYGFELVSIDDKQQIAKFGHYRIRRWYEYTYARNGIPGTYPIEKALGDGWYFNCRP